MRMARPAAIAIMIDDLDLARLMAWLSPVFPTGGFAYSSGLETAVAEGLVKDEADLLNWLNRGMPIPLRC